jgi:uncharacterized membrane protein
MTHVGVDVMSENELVVRRKPWVVAIYVLLTAVLLSAVTFFRIHFEHDGILLILFCGALLFHAIVCWLTSPAVISVQPDGPRVGELRKVLLPWDAIRDVKAVRRGIWYEWSMLGIDLTRDVRP